MKILVIIRQVSMEHNFYAVIMAGGSGTRLWPLSRENKPKQMLKIGSDQTFFQIACDRLKGLFAPEKILVVTIAEQAAELKQQVPEIPAENYLIEPMPRGTASVVGLAATVLHKRDPQAVMVVLTSDHAIENVGYFQKLLRAAYKVAQTGMLVTLGITPTVPSTGYGYIQRGERLDSVDGQPVHKVLRFKEKPSAEAAREMLAGKDHDWNSGMFIWRVEDILLEFSTHMPKLAETLKTIQAAWATQAQDDTISKLWPKIEPQSIDYGIMERAQRVAVLPAAGLGWSDVGSWDAVFDLLKPDKEGNILLNALNVCIDSSQNLVISEGTDRLITTIGVEDMVIIDTMDVLLICKRDEAQKVREAVQKLKEAGQTLYL